MIEEYIEKNILRQLFLCGQLIKQRSQIPRKALQSSTCLQNHFDSMISIT